MSKEIKKDRFSYSRLDIYNQCGWKYKLQYVDKNFFDVESVPLMLGVLIHWIEQRISEAYILEKEPDYDQLKEDFLNCNIPKKGKFDREGGLFGVNIIKQKFPDEFYAIDKQGSSYAAKCDFYLSTGIYRQRDFLAANPDIVLVDVEKYFEITFEGYLITGYIDRVMKYKDTDRYIIDDIKTKGKPFNDKDLITPLQHVIYSMALKSAYELDAEPEDCFYDLPLLDMRQAAGSKGFIKRGKSKLSKLFAGISEKDWEPHPSPLCAYCNFGGTNPNQPLRGKHLCPYYSLWTPDNHTYEVLNSWEGIDSHSKVMQHYLQEQCTDLVEDTENATNNKWGFTF